MGLAMCLTGACKHPEHSTRRDRGLGLAEYPMYAAVIDRGGDRIVVDPGYAPRIREVTQSFPERFYRWATPMRIAPEQALAAQLDRLGLLDTVRVVVLTHFHADHMAGLLDFPTARIVASRAAFQDFARRSGLGAVRSGLLKQLAPADLEERLTFVEDLPQRSTPPILAPFADAADLFGDGSLQLVNLPGHAAGQIGACFEGRDGQIKFLIADAAWSLPAIEANQPPPWLTQRFLGDPRAYRETWSGLRAVLARGADVALRPAHCAIAAAAEGALLA